MIPDAVRVPGGVPAPPDHATAAESLRAGPAGNVDGWTLAPDARILASTAGVVLKGDGAY